MKKSTKGTTPAIRIALKENRLYINQATLFSLGNPQYLQFLYNDTRKLLLVSGENEITINSFEIPRRASHDECYISRLALIEAFRLRMGWNKKENYRIVGEFLLDINMVLFDLSCAMIVRKTE